MIAYRLRIDCAAIAYRLLIDCAAITHPLLPSPFCYRLLTNLSLFAPFTTILPFSRTVILFFFFSLHYPRPFLPFSFTPLPLAFPLQTSFPCPLPRSSLPSSFAHFLLAFCPLLVSAVSCLFLTLSAFGYPFFLFSTFSLFSLFFSIPSSSVRVFASSAASSTRCFLWRTRRRAWQPSPKSASPSGSTSRAPRVLACFFLVQNLRSPRHYFFSLYLFLSPRFFLVRLSLWFLLSHTLGNSVAPRTELPGREDTTTS
jgi:hypothetical protein